MGSFKIVLVSILFVSVVSGRVNSAKQTRRVFEQAAAATAAGGADLAHRPASACTADARAVHAQHEKFIDPCNKNDIKCWNVAMASFMKKTHNGLPKYDMKPLDPLIIPELNVLVDPTMGLVFGFKNINVTGLKKQQIPDFQMDTDKKSIVLTTKAVLNFTGDLKITFTKKNKVFNGAYTAFATVLVSSLCDYNMTKKGYEEHFEIGPEINICEIIGEPVVNMGDVLQNALNNDSGCARDMKPDYEINKFSLWKRALCKIVETAYITVIHNIRALGKTIQKCAFFKDI